VGPSDLALCRLQLDLPEQGTKQERRALRLPLQHLVHAREPLLDPLDGRRPEVAAGACAVIAAITEVDVARRILVGLNLPTRAPPVARSGPGGRAPRIARARSPQRRQERRPLICVRVRPEHPR
jgi:hypothetical protein